MTATQTSTLVGKEAIQRLIEEFYATGVPVKDAKGIDEKSIEACYGVAFNFYQSGRFSDALDVFKFLCLISPYDQKYVLGLAACRQMEKQYKEAIEAYSFAMVLDCNDPIPPFRAAECHMAMGNMQEALSGFTAAYEWSAGIEIHSTLHGKSETMMTVLETKLQNKLQTKP
ncbi:CesD/SycD/LcrH family type III secretion system chaperone [Gammaproteobacteria bacterium 45_16_T64]|nr:CesD/SycD/LcrH family type III secretion system chaperone [Gammaproteobacteria bacterium 45_16_T64]